MLQPTKAKEGTNHSVIYMDDSGGGFRLSGGSWAWRNNNPGNIVPGDVSKRNGQIGVAGGFAVFPDDESGQLALIEVLNTSLYQNKSIDELVEKYAPEKENPNNKEYKHILHQKTGVKGNKKIKDFTPEEFEALWKGVEQMEGYTVGDLIKITPIVKVRQDTKGVINEYCVRDKDNTCWISKKDCLDLAKRGGLDVEVCTSRLGHPYIRARPNSPIQEALDKMVEKKPKKPRR